MLNVCRAGLQGTTDVELMRRAFADNRIIVTHDADFGSLAVLQGEPIVGLVFLRPGHIDPGFTIGTLNSILQANPDVTPPFILVARRTGDTIGIRIRPVVP